MTMARDYSTHLCTLHYVEKAIEAEKRLKRGERQMYCVACGRWRWPEECGHEGRLTQKEFDRPAKRKKGKGGT
jgi:hypothetical protein